MKSSVWSIRITATSMLIICVLAVIPQAYGQKVCTGHKDCGLKLVSDGKPIATIVIPDDTDSWTKMAAGWIVEYVEKSSGATLTVVPESKAPSINLISIGHTKLAAKAGVTTEGLEFDGCKMIVKGNVLYLLGRDTKGLNSNPSPARDTRTAWAYQAEIMKSASGFGAKGTCRSATRFLEKFCGIRWLVPAAQGTYIPQIKNITVPANLNESFSPFFMYHSNRSLYGSPGSRPAAYANNYRICTPLYTAGGHTIPRWIRDTKYWETNPEYFAMINGTRTPVANHLCYTNSDVQELIRKAIADLFDSGYDLVQLGPADGFRSCDCPTCLATNKKYNSPLASVNIPFKKICEDLQKSHPNKFVHLLVYGPCSSPPLSFQSFPDNVIAEICGNGAPALVNAWDGKTGGSTVYTLWYDHSVYGGIGVRITPAEAGRLIKFYADRNVRGIHGGGGYNWGLMGASYYVSGKLMGDPSLDIDKLVKEYCDGLYSSVSDEMIDFFELLWTKSDYKNQSGANTMTTAEVLMDYYPPEFVQKLDILLKKAELAAKTTREKNWVRVSRDEFEYIRLISQALYKYHDYLADSNPVKREQLRQAVNEFDEYRKYMVNVDANYVQNYFVGHGMLTCFLTPVPSGSAWNTRWADVKDKVDPDTIPGTFVGFTCANVGKPLTLDFDSEELERALHVTYTAKSVRLDGILDEPRWQKAKPVFTRGQVQTEMRAIYDKDNLYVAFICQENKPDGPLYYKIDRDSSICAMDVIELFVDPESSTNTQRFYQFIIGAGPEAMYDNRTGFRKLGDFRDQDESWNAPGLKYGFSIKPDKKHWIIEMKVPFKDIGTTTPKSGQVWLGNLARERGGPDKYIWSRGGSLGFYDAKGFGKFIFDKP